jgi:peroxiredoxin Q/BCP
MTLKVLAATAAVWLAGLPNALAEELKVGDPAPDFKLQDSTGKYRSLAEFRGKKAVALVFYPAMFRQGG